MTPVSYYNHVILKTSPGRFVDFKFRGAIEPGLFFNREKENEFLYSKLSQVEKGIKHSYALVGPRRVGKSSILLFLESKLKKKNIVPVLIDWRGREKQRTETEDS